MKIKKLLCSLLAVCMAAAFVGCGEDSDTSPTTDTTPEPENYAVTIGDHGLTAVEFNYYYQYAIDVFYNAWYSEDYGTAAMNLDLTIPLSDQYYDAETETTWADYFVQEALAAAKRDYVLCDLAKAAGFTLSDAQKEELESRRNDLAANAALYGYNDVNDYLQFYYGPDCNTENYTAYLEKGFIADAYYAFHRESITYSQDILRAHDAGDYDAYSSYSFDNIYLSYTYFQGMPKTSASEQPELTTDEDARILLQAAAKELATAGSTEELEEMLKNIQVKDGISPNVSRNRNILRTNLSTSNANLTDWVTAADRKVGDIEAIPITTYKEVDGKVVEQVNGYCIALFKGRHDNTGKMGNVRHLLVKFEGGEANEATDEVTYSDAEKEAARMKAEEYLNMWKTGAANEDYFIELVKKYSQDSSLADGGLFENIHPASGYIEPFENWATDPARQPGETDIIETEYGYHVMYFVGWSELTYRDYMITEQLRDVDQEAWLQETLDAVEAEILDYSGLELDLVLDTGGQETE